MGLTTKRSKVLRRVRLTADSRSTATGGFIQMFGNVVLEIPKDDFERELDRVKVAHGVRLDTDLNEAMLREVVVRYKDVVRHKSGRVFPKDPLIQLRMARNAVFRSWNNPRAIEYRRDLQYSR